MPAFASLWLTSSPAAPARPILVELADPEEPGFHRSHRFPADVDLRATFPMSSGTYRLIGLDGRCGIDVNLLPEREADVVLTLGEDGSCSFSVADDHGFEEGVEPQEPAVLVVD